MYRFKGWGLGFCGALVDRAGPDFLSTSINERSLEYPRILVPGSTVNGNQEPEISCGDGLTCRNICDKFSRTARTGNLPVGFIRFESVQSEEIATLQNA
jgi:hypothetical protein